MAGTDQVLEYKCPCCGAGLKFSQDGQNMACDYCGNTFEIEAVKAYNATLAPDEFVWDSGDTASWSEAEAQAVQTFQCPACGGVLMTDEHTAATFCPYCENPAIIPGRLSGGWKPEGVIPFQTTKEDAKAAFLKLCKSKPLLPKFFTQEQRIEKITGIYVPYWLYNCNGNFRGRYSATLTHVWSDAKYNYTRTDHYLLTRGASAAFEGIPMDASSKLDDGLMESIEPFDYTASVPFETAYLSGFLADKYDVESQLGQERIRQRVGASMEDLLAPSLMGFATVVPTGRQLRVDHSRAKYVLLPVWMLHTKYKDKTYVFAMNGQTGKMTGTFPVCPKRTAAWFAAVCGGVAALAVLVQWLLWL